MYTVLVVDDEAIVCRGIKASLEASGLNITQVLTAWNGYEALDYVRMESVDLVLTDIQMDGMNGIELMESILSEKPEIPVVVISAHDEFGYAQNCIRLGARDYLIKPVLLDQLVQVVGRVLSDRHEKYKRIVEDSLRHKFSLTGMTSIRTYILNEVIAGSLIPSDDDPFLFEQIEVKLAGPYFAMFAVELLWESAGREGDAIKTFRDQNLMKYAAYNIIEETTSDWNAVTFFGQGNRIYTILQFGGESDNLPDRSEHVTKLNLLATTVANNISHCLRIEPVIGVSPPRFGLQQLPACSRQAVEAAKWRSLYDTHNVFYAEDFSMKEAFIRVDWQEKTERFIEWMKTGRRDEERRENILRFISGMAPVFDTYESTTGIALSIAYRVYAMLLDMKETVGERYLALDPLDYFQGHLSGIAIKPRLELFLTEAAALVQTSMDDRDRVIVQQAVEYIRRTFRNKGLKIQDIADHVHLSPNYLSYLFKRIAGETVWEFVTALRMEESRHLLLSTSKKRYEIADEVGYESPEHFSRIFKRFYGESPNTVRQ
ncbi:response regulator [Paenibacillus sp. XY044]|uniref:response regulator transcription factor n=1 Tax=Paenibacillus sp. XY044 TaxID=2026089 RepID=UPI0015C626B0|nr:response regulator [Paenibacillus sp. XY044]